jgi:hypothetical protein
MGHLKFVETHVLKTDVRTIAVSIMAKLKNNNNIMKTILTNLKRVS